MRERLHNKLNEIKELTTVESPLGKLNLVTLAYPVILENLFSILIGTVNTAVLSGYATDSVAAAGTVNILLNIFIGILGAVTTGATILISNYIGAGSKKKMQSTIFSSIVLTIIVTIIISVITLLGSSTIIKLMNLTGNVYTEGLIYLRIRGAALIITAITYICNAIMRCLGHTKVTVVSGVISNIVNVVLNVLVIRNADRCPIPVIAAIALCTVVSALCSLIYVLFAFKLKKIKMEIPESTLIFTSSVKKMLRIGVPASLSSMSFSISQLVTNSFIALLGVQIISSKIYCANIFSYVYLFSVSVGSANSLLIGRLCGARQEEHAEKLNRFLVKITTKINLIISLAIVIFRKQIFSIYTDDKSIITLVFWVLIIDIITEQARAVSQIYEYALRAAGDVYASMVVLLVSCWVFSVGLSYLLSITCGLGLVGCWIGLAIDESIRAIYTYFRWKSGKWKQIHNQIV